MKKLSRTNYGIIIALAILLAIGMTFLYLTKPVDALAFAASDDIPPYSTPVLSIDGQDDCGDLNLTRGQTLTFSIMYNDKQYIPDLFSDTTLITYTATNGKLTISEKSALGSMPICITCTFDDGSNYEEKLLVNVKSEMEKVVEITPMTTEANAIVSLPEGIEYVTATATIQDYDQSVTVKLKNGDKLNDVFAFAPHKSSGITLEFLSAAISTVNNEGIARTMENPNGFNGIVMLPFETYSLSGSGTSLSPYKISSFSDFLQIPNYDNTNTTKYFKQTINFTISQAYTTFDFYGRYNGTLLNCYVITFDNVINNYGLFMANHGTIINLRIQIIDLTLTLNASVGVVCSHNYGSITNVGVYQPSNTISSVLHSNYAYSQIGGIAGVNQEEGVIAYSYTNLILSSVKSYGGICYTNGGFISICQATTIISGAKISSDVKIGGLVAFNVLNGHFDFGEDNSSSQMLTIFLEVSFENTPSPSAPYVGGIVGHKFLTSNIGFDDSTRPQTVDPSTSFFYVTGAITEEYEIYCHSIIGRVN